jgi:ATP-dependent DNA helicase RecQ
MADLQGQLQQHFGLDAFRPAQEEVITDVLAGRDVLCVMPTGAGKSLCYQLPAIVLGQENGGGVTLVVSPLISLMEDQVQQLRDEGLQAEYLSSSQPASRQREVISALARGWSGLLYVAPERFSSPGFSNLLPQLKLNLLAIDEAHCISQWGHDFRPEYGTLGTVRHRLGRPRTIALTATATQDVRADIVAQLELSEPCIYVTGFDRPNLRYAAERIEHNRKVSRVIELLAAEKGASIVYCATRKAVDELTIFLRQTLKGRTVVSYHAGMDPAERTASQEKFMAGDDVIAICTNAFGMGVNKPDTRLVVHHAIPGTLEAYYQEAGRAGRDGQPADCVLLYSFADRKTQEFFIRNIGKDGDIDAELAEERRGHATAKLDLMVNYAQNHRCRRQSIIDYFGEATRIDRSQCYCDVCRKGRVDGDATPQVVTALPEETSLLVRKLLSGIARVNARFGVTTIADILTGSESERLLKFNLQQLPTFGLLRSFGPKPVVAMLHRVMEVGLARQRDPEGLMNRPIVELTAAGIAVMKGQRPAPASLIDIAPRRSARPPAGLPRSSRPRPASTMSTAGESQVDMDDEAIARFERLRVARGQLARDLALPAYVIAHDRVLRAVATECPGDKDALARVSGFGPSRAEKYGDALLTALKG